MGFNNSYDKLHNNIIEGFNKLLKLLNNKNIYNSIKNTEIEQILFILTDWAE